MGQETGENNESKPVAQTKPNPFKKMLQATVLTGAMIFGHGNANTNNNYEQTHLPTGTISQNDQLTHHASVAEVSSDGISSSEKESDVKFEEFWVGLNSGFDNVQKLVISDQKTLENYWNKINTDPNIPVPMLPAHQSILLYTDGQQENLSALKIDSVKTDGEKNIVTVRKYNLANGEGQASSPFDAVTANLNVNLPTSFETIHEEGVYDYSETAGEARIDKDGNANYGPPTLDLTPH